MAYRTALQMSHLLRPLMAQGDDVCQVCDSRGWYTPNVVVGHPDFGRVMICVCQQQRLSEDRFSRLFRYSNLGSLRRFTFDTLNKSGITEDTESQELFGEASRIAEEYADNPVGWLTFVGPNGSGKTHLAAAIAESLHPERARRSVHACPRLA